MELTYSLNEINKVAAEFWVKAEGGKVFAFHGQMGAGKTTFIHALCEVKGVMDVISSPGVEDGLFSGFICLVEWPEKAPAIFPDNTIHVYLEVVDEKTRRIKIAKN